MFDSYARVKQIKVKYGIIIETTVYRPTVWNIFGKLINSMKRKARTETL